MADRTEAPRDRLAVVGNGILDVQQRLRGLSDERAALMRVLADSGASLTEIGKLARLTTGRVHQVLNADRPQVSRLLAAEGRQAHIITVLEMPDYPDEEERLLAAADRVAAVCSGVGLTVVPGSLDDLPTAPAADTIVLCTAAGFQAHQNRLAGAPFAQVGSEWALHDPSTHAYYSAGFRDRDEPSDIGYIGPLELPQGTALGVLGIDFPGLEEAVHAMATELAQLFKEGVGRRRARIFRVAADW